MGERENCAVEYWINGELRDTRNPCEDGHTYGIYCAESALNVFARVPAGSSRGESG